MKQTRPKIDNSRPTALYRLFDSTDELLYVGIGFVPATRWKSHAKKAWGPRIARREVQWFPNRHEARAEELRIIKGLQPPYNVADLPRQKHAALSHAPRLVRKPRRVRVREPYEPDILVQLARQTRRYHKITARFERWIVLEYEAGSSLRDIAIVAKRSHEQVRRILARHNVQIRGRGRAAQPDLPNSPES